MNIIRWAEPLMETAAYSNLDLLQPSSWLEKLKIRLIVLLDAIFASLSATYEQHQALVIQRIKVQHANQDEGISPHLFQKNVLNAKPIVPDEEKFSSPKIPFHLTPKPEPEGKDQEVMNTLIDLIEQGLQDEEIIDIMSDSLAPDQCLPLITQIKMQLKKETLPDHGVKTEQVKGFKQHEKYPVLILAGEGLNQYQADGPAACTPLACKFIASKQSTSPQMLANLIKTNDYKNSTFVETEDYIQNVMHLKIAENPWDFQKEMSPSMQVSFERQGITGIQAAIDSLLNDPNIGGAIFTANAIAISMRKRDQKIEFFDPHGDNTLTPQEGNVAYVQAFAEDQIKLIVDFVFYKFPDIELTPCIEIWPIEAL